MSTNEDLIADALAESIKQEIDYEIIYKMKLNHIMSEEEILAEIECNPDAYGLLDEPSDNATELYKFKYVL